MCARWWYVYEYDGACRPVGEFARWFATFQKDERSWFARGSRRAQRTSASVATNSLIPQPTKPVPPVTMTTFFAVASAPLVSAMIVLGDGGAKKRGQHFGTSCSAFF